MKKATNDLQQEITNLKQENHQLKKKLDHFQNPSSADSSKENFNFSDLIDSFLLQELMEQFYKLTKYPIGIIDNDHNILVATGWQPICTKFYRKNKNSCKLCHESDLFIKNKLKEGKFVEYKCKNGLWDIAQPIIINGKHMATIFLGQFFYEDEKINEPFFLQQADKYNFDKSNFLKALRQVPRFSRNEIQQLMSYYSQLAQVISLQGFLNLQYQTELKRTLKNKIELRRSKNKLDSIIEAIPSPIFVKDLDGKITLCNESFAKKLDLTPEAILGKTDFDIIPETFAIQNQSKDLELINNPGKQIYTTQTEFQDGSKHHIIFHKATYTNEKNEIAGIASMAVDISELENIKNELEKAKDQAEHSDRLKSAFLANMSHEIRTPLNSILGFSNMLKSPILSEVKRDKFIDIINICGEQLLMLISDIIDISKIEANQVSFDEETINLNDVIDSLFEEFTAKAKEQQLLLLPQKALSTNSVNVKTDVRKLRQILSNLLVNSFKFTKKGEIAFGYKIEDDQFVFFVRDTGIGISKENQLKIFDRFYQVEDDEVDHSGTGLGLAITKGFIDFMQGDIQITSALNEGSEFKVFLPLTCTEVEIDKKELSKYDSKYIWSDTYILIAEDEETNYLYLEEVLLPTGAHLIWVKNGNEAIKECKRNTNIDLVLMDLKMPITNGYEATQKIKKFRASLPIIAQTAYAFANDRQKALDAGCDSYIMKPILDQDLYKIIEKYLLKKS